MLLNIVILVGLFMLSFFFSGLETGIVSLDMLKLEKDAKVEKQKRELLNFISKPDKFFGTILIGNNVVNVLLAAVATVIAHNSDLFSREYVSLLIGGLVFLVGEISPKIIFRDHSNTLVPKTFSFLKISYFILRPFVIVVTWLNDWLYKRFNISGPHSLSYLTKDDLALFLANTKEDKTINHPQKEMLEDMLEFNSITAEDIMIPRRDIVGFEEDASIMEIIEIVREEGFTRYPVYSETIDNITGILIIYDILKKDLSPNAVARDLIREPYFAPENISLNVLMQEMQRQQKSMAIVVDSYGGTSGILTFEDIMEEIVGDIEDEYDHEDDSADVIKISEDTFIINADCEVDDLNDEYDLGLPEGNYKTVAGLIIDTIERIPKLGQNISIEGFKIQIIQASERKIEKIKLKKL
ncbi:MAG: hemolysin family protein [Candidatus Cloacimonadales bacterium]